MPKRGGVQLEGLIPGADAVWARAQFDLHRILSRRLDTVLRELPSRSRVRVHGSAGVAARASVGDLTPQLWPPGRSTSTVRLETPPLGQVVVGCSSGTMRPAPRKRAAKTPGSEGVVHDE